MTESEREQRAWGAAKWVHDVLRASGWNDLHDWEESGAGTQEAALRAVRAGEAAADEAVPVVSERQHNEEVAHWVRMWKGEFARARHAEGAARGLAKAAHRLCELYGDPFGPIGSLTDLGECVAGLREALESHPGWLEDA